MVDDRVARLADVAVLRLDRLTRPGAARASRPSRDRSRRGRLGDDGSGSGFAALVDREERREPQRDAQRAARTLGDPDLLEHEVVPLFYTRDPSGLPGGWISRIKTSMQRLIPRFSAERMVREYVTTLYAPTTLPMKSGR